MKHFIYTFILLVFYKNIFAQVWLSEETAQKEKISVNDLIEDYQKYITETDIENYCDKEFLTWLHFAEPRTYPSGLIENKSRLVWKEIKNQNRLDREVFNRNGAAGCTANWMNIGPFINSNYVNPSISEAASPGIGRVNFIKRYPMADSNTGNYPLYIGASNGGLWVSYDKGTSWQTVGEKSLASLGMADLVFKYNNGKYEMYLATGDHDRGPLHIYNYTTNSIGILKSVDGGKKWTNLVSFPEEQGVKIHKLLVNTNGDLIFGTNENKVTGQQGIWKYDFDTNLSSIVQATSKPIVDISIHPQTGPDILCAATYDGKIYRSVDSGNSWQLVSSSILPSTDIGRVALATNPTNNNQLYLLYVDGSGKFKGIYESNDAGNSFVLKINITNPSTAIKYIEDGRGRLALTISPVNSNIVFFSGDQGIWQFDFSTLPPSEKLLTSLSVWYKNYVHPDVHDFEWDGNTLYAAHDGGISKSNDLGNTWSEWHELQQNLCISEFYRFGAPVNNIDILAGGTHDNGVIFFNDNLASGDKWRNIKEGDAAEVAFENVDNIFVSWGVPHRTVKGERKLNTGLNKYLWNINQKLICESTGISNCNQYVNSSFTNHFKRALLTDPLNTSTVFSSHQEIWKSIDSGNTWSQVSNTLNKFPFDAVVISKSNPQYMYASKRGGLAGSDYEFPPSIPKGPVIYQSKDNGNTWNIIYDGNIQTTLPVLYLSSITINENNPGEEIWITFSGYSANNKVYSGKLNTSTWSWNNISGQKLPNVPVNTIVSSYDTNLGGNHLFIGTDIGVYYSNDNLLSCPNGIEWKCLSQNLPKVLVTELEVHETTSSDKLLRASTFGRGIWETDLNAFGGTCVCEICPFPSPDIDIEFFASIEIECNFDTFINADVESVKKDMEVKFNIINESGSIDNFEWYIDGGTLVEGTLTGSYSDMGDITIKWSEPGFKVVTLVIYDVLGNCNTYSEEILVNDDPCFLDYNIITNYTNPTSSSLGLINFYNDYVAGSCYHLHILKDGNDFFSGILDYFNSDPIYYGLQAGTYEITMTDEYTGCSKTETVVLTQVCDFDYSYTTAPAYTQTTTSTGIQLTPNPDCTMVTVSLTGTLSYPITLSWINYVGTLNESDNVTLDNSDAGTIFPTIEVCGTAQLSITDKNGCSLIFTMSGNNATVDNSGGGNENPSATKTNMAGKSYFEIVPNPFKEQVSLHYNINKPEDVKEDIIPISIKAIHISGKYAVELVKTDISFNQNYTQSINLSELPAGLYIFNLETPHQNLITKGIKY